MDRQRLSFKINTSACRSPTTQGQANEGAYGIACMLVSLAGAHAAYFGPDSAIHINDQFAHILWTSEMKLVPDGISAYFCTWTASPPLPLFWHYILARQVGSTEWAQSPVLMSFRYKATIFDMDFVKYTHLFPSGLSPRSLWWQAICGQSGMHKSVNS